MAVELDEFLFRPNSGQLIYCNMKGYLCSIETQFSIRDEGKLVLHVR